MKLVKLKCGTWVNPGHVSCIKRATSAQYNSNQKLAKSFIYFFDNDPLFAEETADEVAEMILEATTQNKKEEE